MSKRLILVDSSAWIAHLTQPTAARAHPVEELLKADRVAINAVIRVEILTGARHEAQYAALEDALMGCQVLPLTDAVWRRAERLRFQLRQAGTLVPLPDVVIACCALVYDCGLLHTDKHFQLIARHAPLKFFQAAA